jgi:hypothetical protein
MPVPSRRLKDDLADDLDHHASIHWPQLGEVTVRWRGGYAYVTGHLDSDSDSDTEDEDGPGIPLCRLGYLGLDEEWEFALYDPATDTYQDSVLSDGTYTGTPQDALDCACHVHLADIPKPTT